MGVCLGPNVGQHFVHAALAAEQLRNRQTGDELAQIQEIRDKMKDVTELLKHLETKSVGNPNVIEFADEAKDLLERVNEISAHDLFKKESWTKEEAEAVKKHLDRLNETLAGDINPHNVQMGDLLHMRNEVVRIVGKILEMLNKHLENVESRMNK